MTVAEMMACTPGELDCMIMAAQDRDHDEWFRQAWLAAQITPRVGDVWAKKGTRLKSPLDLLGWGTPRPEKFTPRQWSGLFQQVRETFGGH